jgi:hypothetical protein
MYYNLNVQLQGQRVNINLNETKEGEDRETSNEGNPSRTSGQNWTQKFFPVVFFFSVFEKSHTFSFVTFCCKIGSEIGLLCVRSGEITLEALVAQSVTQLSRLCTFLPVRLTTRKADSQDINVTLVCTLQTQRFSYLHVAGNKEREMQIAARTTSCWFT